MKGFWCSIFFLLVATISLTAHAQDKSPVGSYHIQQIDGLFQQGGISQGWVKLDRRGRVELSGAYENEKQVDLAFSLAQSVVGVRWVSPVKPEGIKVKEWERKLEQLFPTKPGSEIVASADDDDAPGPVGHKYALLVGIARFKKRINPLKYTDKDARDFYDFLTDPAGGNFPRENVILLTNEEATRQNIQRALDSIREKAQADDLVLVYLSSHGTPPDKYGGVHVVAYDTEVIPRQRVWETSVSEDILQGFINGVKAKRLIVVLDACYSNGAYSKIAGFLPPGGKSLGADDEEGSGRSRTYMAKRLLGAKDLIPEEPGALSPKGWGKVLFSASNGDERSWELDSLQNSAFTHFFIRGLRASQGVLKEAFDYAHPRVVEAVRKEKGEEIEQHPQITPSRKEWNMSIAVLSRR